MFFSGMRTTSMATACDRPSSASETSRSGSIQATTSRPSSLLPVLHLAVFEFIEGWYDRHRRHSAFAYESPIKYKRSQLAETTRQSPQTVDATGLTPQQPADERQQPGRR